jgi:hypothetical protein
MTRRSADRPERAPPLELERHGTDWVARDASGRVVGVWRGANAFESFAAALMELKGSAEDDAA